MKLELLLKGVDQMSGVVKKQSVFIKQLDRDATKAYNSLKKLFSLSPKGNFGSFGKQSTADFRKANSEAAKYKKTLESIGKIKMPKMTAPSFDGSPKVNLKQGQKELDKLYGKRQGSNKYVSRLANLNDRVLEPASQIKNVWRDQLDSLKPYVEETKKLYRAQEKFKLLNLSEGDNKNAFDTVKQIVKSVRGATLSDTTEDLIDLYGALGNLSSATQSLPLATKFRTNFTALYGDKLSSEEIGTQIQSGFKFLEIIGATNKGRAEMEKTFDTITKISASTGGRVTGEHFLAMAKTGKTATKNLSTEGLMNISSLIEETGAGNTGTAMMSMYQALVGGVMKQSSAERFDYFGLLDQSKIEYGKAQRIKRLKPGANKLGDSMQEDPLKAADMLREAMKAKGVNVADAKAVDKELSVLFQNRNAQALMSQLINQRDQVVKEADRAKKAKGILGIDDQLANSELKKIQEFEAAIKNFKTEAGKPLIQIGTQLASSLMPLLGLAAEHPMLTKFALAAILTGKGIASIAQTASILKGGSLASIFSGAGDSAGNASTKVAGFARGLDTATTKTSKLRGAFQNLSNSPAVKLGVGTAALVGAEILLTGLIQKQGEINAQSEQILADSKEIRAIYDEISGNRLRHNAPGNYKDKEGNDRTDLFDKEAAKFLESAQMGRELLLAFHPDKATWWESWNFDSPFGVDLSKSLVMKQQFDPAKAASTWKDAGITAPLHDPNSLARVMVQLQKDGGIKDEAGNPKFNFEAISSMFKTFENIVGADKFKIASDLANKELGGGDKSQYGRLLAKPLDFLNPTPIKPFQSPYKQPPTKFEEGMLTSSLFNRISPQIQELSGGFNKLPNPVKEAAASFNNVSQPVNQFQTGMLGLQQPTAGASQQLSNLNTNASSSANAINLMTGAAFNFANTVSTLKITPPTFGAITLPPFGQPAKPPPSVGGNPNILRLFGGGKAKGGSVNKGKAYMVGEAGKEMFLPEASGSIVSNDALRNRRNTNSVAQNTTVHNHFNITGTNADEIANKVLSRLEARIADLEFDTSPERMAQRVVYVAKRDSERI